MAKAKRTRTVRPHGGWIGTVDRNDERLDGLFGKLNVAEGRAAQRKALGLPEKSATAQRRLVEDAEDRDGAELALARWWLDVQGAVPAKDLGRLRTVAQWLLDYATSSPRAAEFDALAQAILVAAEDERTRAPDPETGLRAMTLHEFVAGKVTEPGPNFGKLRALGGKKAAKAFDGAFIRAVESEVGDAHLYDLKTRLGRAAAFYSTMPMHEIDTAAAKEFVARLQKEDGRARLVTVGHSDDGKELTETRHAKKTGATVDRYRAALSKCWEVAIENGFAASNPWRSDKKGARRGKRGKARKFQPRFLTPDEVARILAHVPERFRPMFEFQSETGLRLSEAQALTWQRVAPAMARVNVEDSKSANGVRDVPCSARAKEILEQRWREHVSVTSGPDLVFPHYERTYLWTVWQRACIAAGVGRGVRVHDLRHYFGSSLAQNGTPLSTIQKLMGHGSARMTEIYASHVPGNAAERAIAALDATRRTAPAAAAAGK